MSETALEKRYKPHEVEEKWMALWERSSLFHAAEESDRPPFSMVIPPPNVTGSLHLGHALNNTLQDILARWKRMSGYNVLWLPGTDHAGIATQNVVERQLAKKNTDRHVLGREKFIEQVWHWKEESGGTILKQLKRLGSSCDWKRERFTMDEGLSRAVQEVFVRLYKEGLIYRDKRLINLCPHCRTALSDIEVEHEEIQGKMYYIKYPLADDPETFLTIATTRPETMLGDTAVAVHPEDSRFKHLIGKNIKLPLTDRTIPIIGDPVLVDREFGTGAVKITPGHDFNDEKSGKRHSLEVIDLIGWDGTIDSGALIRNGTNPELADKLAVIPMTDARKIVVKKLDEADLLLDTKDHLMSLGKCYRCKTVIEPFRSPQWFVKTNDPENSLAQAAIDAVREKKIKIIPSSWEPNYFGWMENIEDWCISRQIWWGHQIPVLYCRKCDVDYISELSKMGLPDSDTVIIRSEANPIVGETSCPLCGSDDLIQDPDVLDTWFSSALWPFSTLGWPAELQADEKGEIAANNLLRQFYPTSTLVSAFDILFFWIARMIMMGLHFMKEIPFKEVYIHALVRDAEGQKMSKSKGNVIDPLEIMNRHGTDALRFTLAAMASPGRDIKLSEERIEGYRNFANKIWNAARFIKMNRSDQSNPVKTLADRSEWTISDHWILSRLHETIASVNNALETYRFDQAAQSLYQFIWHAFCDWYLELVKVDLQKQTKGEGSLRTLSEVFDTILKLLHPFMPFLTEELRSHFQEGNESLSIAPYPKLDPGMRDASTEEIVQDIIIDTVIAVRNHRGEMNIPPSEALSLLIKVKDQAGQSLFEEHLPYIKGLARLGDVVIGTKVVKPKTATSVTTRFGEIYIPLDEARVRDEVQRVEKRLLKLEKTLDTLRLKLKNPNFTGKAPKDIVDKTKKEQQDLIEQSTKFSADLQYLRALISNE